MFPTALKQFGPCKEVGNLTGKFYDVRPEEQRLLMSMKTMEMAKLRPWQKTILDALDRQNRDTIMFVVAPGQGRNFLSRYIEDMRSAFRFENPISYRECMDAHQNESCAVIYVDRSDVDVFNYDVVRDLKEKGCRTLVLLSAYPDRRRLVKYMKGQYQIDVMHVKKGAVNPLTSYKIDILTFC